MQHLSIENLLKVFSTVLLEGKVIFVAQQLGLGLLDNFFFLMVVCYKVICFKDSDEMLARIGHFVVSVQLAAHVHSNPPLSTPRGHPVSHPLHRWPPHQGLL